MRPAVAAAEVRSPHKVTEVARGEARDTSDRAASPSSFPAALPHPSRERIRTVIAGDHDDIAKLIAGRIAELIRTRNTAGRRAVLGLATGSTPIGVYRELIRLHREEGLSFANVEMFNLDEYYPMPKDSIG